VSQEERTLSNMRNVATNVQDDSVLVCYGEREHVVMRFGRFIIHYLIR
jgi:hypothetical protein